MLSSANNEVFQRATESTDISANIDVDSSHVLGIAWILRRPGREGSEYPKLVGKTETQG